jgi:hypothetical protein
MTSKHRKHSNDDLYAHELSSPGLLSPSTSPDRRNILTKRQEQNRAAQRAFRERRAQTLKEMEVRLSNLEKLMIELNKRVSTISVIEDELGRLKGAIGSLYNSVEAMSVPSWSVPTSEDDVEVVVNPGHDATIGALRSSSTDPTLAFTD